MFDTEFSPNDWRDYIEHGWGHTARQKAMEKAYNAMYWRKNKDKIMAKRRQTAKSKSGHRVSDDRDINNTSPQSTNQTPQNTTPSPAFSGTTVNSAESFKKRTEEEIAHIRAMIEANEKSGDYTPGELANIKRHNEMIIENLQKLYDHVSSKADSYSSEDQVRLYEKINEKINEQINYAHDKILDLKDKKTEDYLSGIGINRKSPSGSSGDNSSSSSSGTSSSSSGKSSKKEDETEEKERQTGATHRRGVSDKRTKDWSKKEYADGQSNGYKYEDVLASRRKGDQQIRDLQEKKRKEDEIKANRPKARETNVTGSAAPGSIKRREKVEEKLNRPLARKKRVSGSVGSIVKRKMKK